MDGGNFTVANAVRYDQIQRFLKQYEMTALNSLGGPAAALLASTTSDAMKTPSSAVSSALATFMLHRETPNLTSANRDRPAVELMSLRQAIPVQPFPVLTPSDRTSAAAEKQETVLEGEYIACFPVGGEKRLCLPQILSTVLKDFSMVDINRARTDLSIYCNHCTPEQLNALKTTGVLASNATSCGLITKTDAERLCNYLLRQKQDTEKPTGALATTTTMAEQKREKRRSITRSVPEPAQSSPRVTSTSADEAKDEDIEVPVMHLCFGRCRGRYHARLYASPSAECIECDECGDYFAPDRFVMHSHRNQERRTCHWGFDSANWRAYIHLPAGGCGGGTATEMEAENAKILEQMKLRFDVTGLTKRKLDEDIDDAVQLKKRLKLELGDQGPVTSTSCMEKLPITTLPTAASFGSLDQQQTQQLPYLLCDPVFLVAYYHTLLSANVSNKTTTMFNGNSCTPSSLLPPMPPPASSLTSAPCGIDSTTNPMTTMGDDGLGATKAVAAAGFLNNREQQLQAALNRGQLLSVNATTATTDEATAAAALKLLQLRAIGDIGNECGGNARFRPQPPPPIGGQETSKKTTITTSIGVKNVVVDVGGQTAEKSGSATTMTSPYRSTHVWSSSSKEPFKKQLLHLFAVEQQQKQQQEEEEEQQNQRQTCEVRQTDNDRASVEVIVDVDDDDDELEEKKLQINESTPAFSDPEKCAGITSGRESEETQIADESSGSSDGEGAANGEASLDDLLKRYVTDEEGLRVVRAKIAANQRYLEQKLDAVVAENRLLRAERLHLKTRQYQLQQEHEQQQQHNAAVGLNFMGLLSRSVKS